MLEPAIAHALADTDRPIVITGASGWLGLATLDLLERALGEAFADRVQCFGSAPRDLDLGDGRVVRQYALADLAAVARPGAWVLHFAFLTKDRAEAMDDAAYRAANQQISDTVLAGLDAVDAAAVFVASSGAAYKAEDPAASPAMRLYGAMKREDEDRFADWATARGKRAVIGRIFNITGPFINKHQAYAMASFILDALATRPIEVRAPREVIRGYVAIRELVSLIFALLGDAPSGVTRFDTGGEALELGAVAAVVAEALQGPGVSRAPVTDPVADRYAGDGEAYAALLARHGITPVPLGQQVVETADYLQAAGHDVRR
ncbi:NAD-dependent epimerase/dehydratase family protein [Sphingomonas sp. OTU376]|uniref:NAD-dependent epimerase/dehydratase family protein n=1 Tax=Sphingomonas sp. OTU376 TaxID=3043863 RepID=UPI00313A89D4